MEKFISTQRVKYARRRICVLVTYFRLFLPRKYLLWVLTEWVSLRQFDENHRKYFQRELKKIPIISLVFGLCEIYVSNANKEIAFK